MRARIYCNSRFKNYTTEELVEMFGELREKASGCAENGRDNLMENISLRVAIREEVYSRFSEHMRDIGMREFMVDVQERWMGSLLNLGINGYEGHALHRRG